MGVLRPADRSLSGNISALDMAAPGRETFDGKGESSGAIQVSAAPQHLPSDQAVAGLSTFSSIFLSPDNCNSLLNSYT
jgi:hypothetical protein